MWLEDDRVWALALLAVEDEACKGCGEPIADSTNPELEEMWRAEVIRCHACATAGRHMESWQQAGGDQHGANIRITRRENSP